MIKRYSLPIKNDRRVYVEYVDIYENGDVWVKWNRTIFYNEDTVLYSCANEYNEAWKKCIENELPHGMWELEEINEPVLKDKP